MTRPAALLLAVFVSFGACSDPPGDEIGPFTGAVTRFVVDRVEVPSDGDAANRFAADLDGDSLPDNKFGYATAVLASTTDLTSDTPDMIASGALAPVVELQADDLTRDDSVGVRFFTKLDDSSFLLGGALNAGAFASAMPRDREQACCAFVALPVFVNADPVVVPLDAVELQLTPDGAGGYDAVMRGGIDERAAREAAHRGLVQMFATEPERHLVFLRSVDTDQDDALSFEEVEASVIGLLVKADIALFGTDDDSVSVAFGMHLTPCADGLCRMTSPQNGCRDRVRDGTETDVDCGGSCQRCASGLTCSVASDCQSNACDNGTCRAPTCSDGVRDGYESDIDCGGICPACAVGKTCAADRDCASNSCDMGVAAVGSCR